MVARTVVGVSPEQLESYSEAFRHFDTDHSNSLNRHEFKAAMQANGIAYGVECNCWKSKTKTNLNQDEEFENTFTKISRDGNEITFEEVNWENETKSS